MYPELFGIIKSYGTLLALSFVAVAFWNLVGAGVFGFLINPPIILYYIQGKLAAFNLCFVQGDLLIDKFIGFAKVLDTKLFMTGGGTVEGGYDANVAAWLQVFPQRVADLLPKQRIDVQIEILSPRRRLIAVGERHVAQDVKNR